MLRIFIHSMSSGGNNTDSQTRKDEEEEEEEENQKESITDTGYTENNQERDEYLTLTPDDMTQHSAAATEGTEHSEKENNDKEKEAYITLTHDSAKPHTTRTKDTTPHPSTSILHQNLSCVSESLLQLLSQEETMSNFTQLEPRDLQDKEQLRVLLHQLCEAAQSTETLRLELHHTRGLQQGLEEERHTLQEEVTRLTHYSKNLARELQELKDRVQEQQDTGQEHHRPVSHYAAKMEATKDVRERVRCALSAKNVSEMERGQLEDRVRELEGLLEAVVRESEVALEALRAKETDLSQQLEVADRQLRSARQFLEEHASERDQEVEELEAVKDKLTMQLREREAQLSHQANQEKEVENLERQLWKKTEELQDALSKSEELHLENRGCKDKISDLREIIQSLESQVDSHCMKESELTQQVDSLTAALTLTQQQIQQLSAKVEEQRVEGSKQRERERREEDLVRTDKLEVNVPREDVSLSSELQDDETSTSVLYKLIERRLRDTTRGLEAMQLSGSLDDISAQEVEVAVMGNEGRLSPSTIDRRLEDQLLALECTTEAAIKRNKDLQLIIKNLQAESEEVSSERDSLQDRCRDQLVKISSLESRLDEVRRSDHPAAADMRQRLALLQEELEERREEGTKRGREVNELKHTLSSLREQLATREGELQQLQIAAAAASQPHTAGDHSPTTHQHTRKDQAVNTDLSGSPQKESVDVIPTSSLLPSLAEELISEKNVEITELNHKMKTVMDVLQSVYSCLSQGGKASHAKKMLSRVVERDFVDGLNGSEEEEEEQEELLRRGEPQDMSSLAHEISSKDSVMISVSPVPLQPSSETGEDSAHTQTSPSLISQPAQPPPRLSQDRLEEDFRSVQELLEDREAEILQLTEEVDDALPLPLPTPPTHQHSTDFKELHSRLTTYEEQVNQLSTSLERKSEEVEQLSTSLERKSEEVEQLSTSLEKKSEEVNQLFTSLQRKNEEVKQLSTSLEKKNEEVEQLSTSLQRKNEEVNQLSTSLEKKNKQVEQLSTSLQKKNEEVNQLSTSLQKKSKEVDQLTTQLEHIHTEMKERLSLSSRETTLLEQQYQQHLSDLREQHTAQEKRLCQEYEKRMARQVEEVIQNLKKKNEAAMMRHQEAFEAALHQTALERRKSEENQELSPPPLPPHSPPPPQQQQQQQTAAQLCASVDGLIAGLKQELEKAGQLDTSMACLMRAGESRDTSTRASSNLSDGSNADEPNSVTGKIQHLMNKIHKEGIEVLTLIDILFLCQHHTHLDSDQSSVLASSSVIAKSLLERGGGGGGVREQTQLMHNLAAVEEELAKKEQEMKRKVEVMEFQLDQEKMSGSEWRMSYESEKQHTRELMEQLQKERLTGAEQVSELTLLRSQLLILRLQHQKLQEENCNIMENQEKKDKVIESLRAALQTERNNFSQVSKVLTEERNVSSLTHSEQEAIIKDLRNSLEKERERIVSLCNHLERMSNQPSTTTTTTTIPQPQPPQPPQSSTTRHSKPDSTKPTIKELQIQLAVERERYGELKMTCERERLQAVSLREQATAERSQSKVEVRRVEGRLADLMRNYRSLETEKERLARQISHEKDRLHYQDSRIKELEGEVRRLEADTQAQSEAHQAVTDRMREEGTQLHLAYTRTLTKLGEVEAEVCELRHKLRSTDKELQVAKEEEEQLKQELHAARTAVDRICLPDLFKVMSPDRYSDMQMKGNLELCRSMLRLTDDQRALRVQIVELEDTVRSLKEQLRQAKESSKRNISFEEILKSERQVWETEKASLQHLKQRYEAETHRLRTERNTQQQQSTPGNAEVQQLYARYLQSEHWRKALVWQKQYLMLVLKGYTDTEQHTLMRLTTMASQQPSHAPSTSSHAPSTSSHTHTTTSHSKPRFRVAAFVVVAVCRMKHLALRFQRKKRRGLEIQVMALSAASTPENPEPQSRSNLVRGMEARPTSPQLSNVRTLTDSFTGLTPPTRELNRRYSPTGFTTNTTTTTTHRSLFQDDSRELNQYVERLDNIHSVLGLTRKKY